MVSKQQKTSPISINQKIDYKDIDLLTLFVTEGKILPRRATVTVQQQLKKRSKEQEY
jgi:small subunit ribosomal protein S18